MYRDYAEQRFTFAELAEWLAKFPPSHFTPNRDIGRGWSRREGDTILIGGDGFAVVLNADGTWVAHPDSDGG